MTHHTHSRPTYCGDSLGRISKATHPGNARAKGNRKETTTLEDLRRESPDAQANTVPNFVKGVNRTPLGKIQHVWTPQSEDSGERGVATTTRDQHAPSDGGSSSGRAQSMVPQSFDDDPMDGAPTFPGDLPDVVLQRIPRQLLSYKDMCRVACVCRYLRSLAADEVAWSSVCEAQRINAYAHLKQRGGAGRWRGKGTLGWGDDTAAMRARPKGSNAAFEAWHTARSGPAGAITHGPFGDVRSVHPRGSVPSGWRASPNTWAAGELLPVPSLSLHPALEPLSHLCSREGSQGAMLLHAGRCSSALEQCNDPSTGRPRGGVGQLVMAVGAGVFDVRAGALGCRGNVTLLLNIVADASMRAFSSD